MPPTSIPAGYRCIACGYDAGELPGHVCPECGAPLTDEAVAAWQARVQWQEQYGRLLGLVASGALIVCIVYSIVAAVVARSAEVGLIAMVAMSFVAGASIGAGLLCSVAAPPGACNVVAAIWLRWLWILHLPWLIVGPGALMVIAGIACARAMGFDPEPIVVAVGLVGYLLWIVIVMTAPIAWLQSAHDSYVQARLRIGPSWALMVLVALSVAVMATVLSALGGDLALMAPLEAW